MHALCCCLHARHADINLWLSPLCVAGSFSFPNVPPAAELEYDLELVDYEIFDEVITHRKAATRWSVT